MGDPTSQRLIRVAGAIGALISLSWLIFAVRSIPRLHRLNREWDGVTCCDPQEDIVAFYMMAALCLAFLVISYLLAWLKDSPVAALVLVFLTFVPMVTVSIDLLRQYGERSLEVSTGFLVVGTVANALVVVLVLIAWLHERTHVVPYQSKWQSTNGQL
jgi:hypothetical protein